MVRYNWNNWKTKKIIIISVVLFILYLCLRFKSQTIITSAVLRDTRPIDVWEFVADFSNMKKLNPTIKNFNILSEDGNFDHWKYTVEYVEDLSHWPYLENIAVGHFSVKPEGTDYIIESTHKTCFLIGLFCLNSHSTFKFSPATGHSTRCTEKITFDCPAIFSSFCRREAEYQRQAIMDNLRLQFNSDVA